jgi:hypothetical protein
MEIKYYLKPKLKEPYMIVAWPGMGNVAIGVARYLRDKLKTQFFAEIELLHVFKFIGVSVNKDSIVETPKFEGTVKNKFYYWENKDSSGDLIIFMGEVQPSGMEHKIAYKIIEVAEEFNVKKIFTAAAFALPIEVEKESKVYGVATDIELLEDLKKVNVHLMNGGNISGLNGFLLEIAKEKGIESICLLGEMPSYLTHIEYPKASYAVLSILSEILNIKIDMGELLTSVKYQENKIKKYLKEIEKQIQQLQLQQEARKNKPDVFH